MGIYAEQLLPRVQDRVMGRKSAREVRARVRAGLHGVVVKIGFGTGLNVQFYPPEVTRVLAVEPSTLCMRLAEPRIARSGIPVELAGLTVSTSTFLPKSSMRCCRPGRCARFLT